MNFIKAFSILLLSSALASCRDASKKADAGDGKLQYAPQVNEVEVMTLQRTDFQRQLLSNGKLSAVQKASLNFSSSGVISEIFVRNGQRVAAGTVLATLDREDILLALRSAEIAMEKAELDLYDVLAGQGYRARDTTSVPKDVLELARKRSGYNSALNNLRRARYDRGTTSLRAPFGGRVADIKLKRFDRTGGSFCTLVDDSSFDVDFTVMESEWSFVEAGQEVKVTPFGAGGRTLAGRITSVNPLVDRNGQIDVRARVPNTGGFIDGMNVKVVVEKAVPGQLVVPKSAVVIRDNLDVLFTCTDDGKAHWTYVNILASNGDSHSVTANKDRGAELKEGDAVIVSGNLNLADLSDVVIKAK